MESMSIGRLDGPIREIRYFGDLDEDGLRIPRNASQAAAELGLPPVLPAVGLYRRLFDHGLPQDRTPVTPIIAAELSSWLPDKLAERAAACLGAGQRLAQEAVGRDLLIQDPMGDRRRAHRRIWNRIRAAVNCDGSG